MALRQGRCHKGGSSNESPPSMRKKAPRGQRPAPRQGRAQAAAGCGSTGRPHAHRQGAGAGGAVLAPRCRALDRAGPRQRQRQGAGEPGAATSRPATASWSTAIRCPRPSRRACGAITSPRASSPRTPTRRAGPPCSMRCPSTCRASFPSAGSTSTAKGCCCSPTTARWPATWSCPPPAGRGATACARTAPSRRPRSTS